MMYPYSSSGSGWHLSVLVLTVLLLLASVGADYTLEIQLEEYANTFHIAEDGFCCESVSGMCMDDCDSRFLFCLRPASFDQSSEDCPLGCYSTGVIGGDSITFPTGELDDGVLNPLVFNGSRWPGSVQLYIRVDDVDEGMLHMPPDDPDDERVTRFYIEQPIAVSSTFSSSGPLHGTNPNVFIRLSQRVSCTENFFPPNCTIFCEERDDAQGHYTCDSEGNIVCRDGYNDTSTNCTVDLDPCSHTLPCQSGGTCMNIGPDMYRCMCPEEFEGVVCELNRTDECDSDPCEHGATCMDLFMNYTCECVDGYKGNNCEMDINECDSNPCQNRGTCTNLGGGYNCSCAEGYEEEDCSQEINECIQLKPCRNGATCTDFFLNYTCECADGYEGRECGADINECDSNPCQNRGTCTNLGGGYNCTCAEGYEGGDCSQEINECILLEPCRNGATCVDLFLDYTCECADGYEGRDCGADINECDSNPCQSGGSCTDLVADYSCSCSPGFSGRNCEAEEEEFSDSEIDVSVIVGAVVAGILLVLIVFLVVVLVLILRRKQKRVIISESLNEGASEPVHNAVFPTESYEHPGAIPLNILVRGKTETGNSSDHKFDNPIYGSGEREVIVVSLNSGLGVYYSTLGDEISAGQYDQQDFHGNVAHPYVNLKTEGGKPMETYDTIDQQGPPPQSMIQTHVYDYAESSVQERKQQVKVHEEHDVNAETEPHIYHILEDPREKNAPVHKYNYIENNQRDGLEPPHDYDYADTPSTTTHDQIAIRSSWPYEYDIAQHYEFGPDAQDTHV